MIYSSLFFFNMLDNLSGRGIFIFLEDHKFEAHGGIRKNFEVRCLADQGGV